MNPVAGNEIMTIPFKTSNFQVHEILLISLLTGSLSSWPLS